MAKDVLGIIDLKDQFALTPTVVECPVRGCSTRLDRRQRADAVQDHRFLCDQCKIWVYPSTFEYVDEKRNLLWKDKDDEALLTEIKRYKAEVDRLGRERSEDAVSWNVFRHFDRTRQLGSLLTHLGISGAVETCKVIYWSYSADCGNPWPLLLEARKEFGEAESLREAETKIKGVSEPDIILLTTHSLIFVEAKFGSDNKTSGKVEQVTQRVANPKRYCSGGGGWYRSVFNAEYATVVEDQKYELLRFWLLGSWLAEKKLGRNFILANLVREQKETGIEKEYGRHILQTESRRFVRWTWESLGSLLNRLGDQDSARLRSYLVQKTIGFAEDKQSQLARPIKAFVLT